MTAVATWQNPMRARIDALTQEYKERMTREKLRPFVTLIAHMIYQSVAWNGKEERRLHDWSMANDLFPRWLLRGNDVGSNIDQWISHLDTPEGCTAIYDTVIKAIEHEIELGTFKSPYGELNQVPQVEDGVKASFIVGIIGSAIPR